MSIAPTQPRCTYCGEPSPGSKQQTELSPVPPTFGQAGAGGAPPYGAPAPQGPALPYGAPTGGAIDAGENAGEEIGSTGDRPARQRISRR